MRRSTGRAAAAVWVGALALGACGGSGGDASKTTTTAASSSRPTTSAQLQIVDPAANQVEKPDFTLKLALTGATVVPQTTGPLRADEGHIHVSIDGQLVSMAYGTTQDLHGIAPGNHTIEAEFVATDHRPFRNRVVSDVLFQVQP